MDQKFIVGNLLGEDEDGSIRGIIGGLVGILRCLQLINSFQGMLRGVRDDGRERQAGRQQRQAGGPITIPGSSFGDSYEMDLPVGSFVLNRMASQHFQNGGMVQTLLEPGEKVFLPGTYGPEIPMMNDMIPRFQKGGRVKLQEGGEAKPEKDTSKEPVVKKGKNKKTGKGGTSAVVSAGKMLLNEGFTVAEHPNFSKGQGFRPKGDARVGGHSPGSLHYSNLALDVTDWRNGDWRGRTKELAEKMYSQKEKLKLTKSSMTQGSWFGGKGGGIGGHDTHLHLSFSLVQQETLERLMSSLGMDLEMDLEMVQVVVQVVVRA